MNYMIINLIILLTSCLNQPDGKSAMLLTRNTLMTTQEIEYKVLYDSTISFIKQHEGFEADWYDDNGYACIGYGQRQAFYADTIIAPITEQQGHDILVRSFEDHIRIARYYYPRVSKVKQLAIAHMSFCFGIGKVRKLKLIEGTTLNTHKLLTLPHPNNRYYEIRLFNWEVHRPME